MTCSRCPNPADVWCAVNADPARLCYGCHLAATATASATGGWIATDWTADLAGPAPRFPRRPVSEPAPEPAPPPRPIRRRSGLLARRAVVIVGLCVVDGCDRKPRVRGLCDACSRLVRQRGQLGEIANPAQAARYHDRKNQE